MFIITIRMPFTGMKQQAALQSYIIDNKIHNETMLTHMMRDKSIIMDLINLIFGAGGWQKVVQVAFDILAPQVDWRKPPWSSLRP